jgi:hypothetical protein
MTVTVQIDAVGLDWLARIHAIDERALEPPADMRQVRQAVGEALTAVIKLSSRV